MSVQIRQHNAFTPRFDTPADAQGQRAASARGAAVDGQVLGDSGQSVQSLFKRQFAALAGKPAEFHQKMAQIYGKGYDKATAEQFRKKALAGDFSWLPKVQYVDGATLKGANGAYDKQNSVVYLNAALKNNPQLAARTFVEEVGHHLDTKLNTSDTPGDEGEMFRRVLGGEKLSRAQIAAIRSENDKGTITVNGKKVEVEFWNPFKAIKKAVKKVGKAIGGAVKKVGKAIGGAVKKVGKAIGGAAKKVGGVIAKGVKFVGGAVSKAVGWIAPRVGDAMSSLVNGAVDTVVGIGKNLWESAKTFGGGLVKVFKGDFKGGFKDMGMGLLKLAQTPVDATLMAGGKAISAIQTMVGLEPAGRKLKPDEIRELKKVYGNSIDYGKVRIKEGFSGVFSASGRAMTHGNTIYIPKGSLPLKKDLLVHEMAHVWQHQNGGTDYMSEALWAQNFGDGYDFEKGLKQGKSWGQLNPEQQAEFIQEAYKSGYFDNPGKGFTHNGVDYTKQLQAALAQIKAGKGAP